jgi:hypothetical protein
VDPPEFFRAVGSRGFYRPQGTVTFEQGVEWVAQAISYARQLGLVDLVANTTGLNGFASPSTIARYSLAVRWAEAVAGALRVAVVSRPEFIDPQKIGVLMAQNRGLNGDVFSTELAALAWLDARI